MLGNHLQSFQPKIPQFSSSPFDIAESIATVSATISSIARIGKTPDAMEMSFDDFFAVFALVLAAAPPVNACGIAELLAVFDFLDYSQVLKHAVAMFTAWVDFVESFPTNPP
jgi:hypothetical protein